MRTECALQLERQKKEHMEALQFERLKMQDEKNELMSMTDKELLVEIAYTLHKGYAIRMEALEKAASGIAGQIATVRGKLGFVESDIAQLLRKQVRNDVNSDAFSNNFTENDLHMIVSEVTKRHEYRRIVEYCVEGATVNCVVNSINGYSTWTFYVDFDDDGDITGNYYCSSDNEDSSLPQNYAEALKKEIVYRLHETR